MSVLEPAWKEIMQFGIVGAFLVLSMLLNWHMWRRLQLCQAEKIELLQQHEDEKSALYERFMAARDTVIEKYHDFVRQSDRTMSDMLRAVQVKEGRRGS